MEIYVVPKWEYTKYTQFPSDDLVHELNMLGLDGWELVCKESNTFYFKRPLW